MSDLKDEEDHKQSLTVACPTCGKQLAWAPASKWRPFCSERCRLIDLGDWLTEENKIPGTDQSAV